MKKLITIIILLALISLIAFPLYASDVIGATYTATLRASNNGTLSDNVCEDVSIDIAQWITDSIINSSANNCAAVGNYGADSAFMPGYGGNPSIIWYDSVPAEAYSDATLYVGGNVTGGISYFPGTTGMYIVDNADIEMGGDFLLEIKSRIETSSSSYIAHKSSAFDIYTSGDGTITLNPHNQTTPTTTLDPNGIGSITNIPHENPGSSVHWTDCQDNNDGTYVYSEASTTWYEDHYALQDGTFTDTDNITSVEVFYRVRSAVAAGSVYCVPLLFLDGWTVYGTDEGGLPADWVWRSDIITRPGGGNWSYDDIPDLQVGLYMKGNPSDYAYCSEVYVVVTVTNPDTTVTLSNVPSGEYTLLAYNEGDNTLYLELEDTEYTNSVSTDGRDIPDNGNNLYIGYAAATPYIEYARLYVDHTNLEGSWVWEYDTTFTDLTGNSHTANPTFRTTGTDGDITTALLNFSPSTLAQADAETSQEWPTMITDAPDEPTTAYTEESRPGIFFEPLIYSLSNAADIPESLFWYLFSFIIILGAGIIVYYFFAAHNQQALLVKFITMLIIMIAWALPGPNIYGFYVVIYFIMWGFGLLVLSKSYGW